MDLSFFKLPSYHTHAIAVHSYDIDYNSRLNVFSLFNYFQEIAWEHAGILGFGKEDLEKRNLFWVLSRVRVEIERLPLWTEKLTLITYPRGIDGLFALRDYEIYDSLGKRVISGSSSWLILSAQTRRPVRLTDLDLQFVANDRSALEVNPSKISDPVGTPLKTESFLVKPSDIDVNFHVNNARYVEWAYNSFPILHFKEFIPKVVEVNFLAEGKSDDNVDIELFKVSDEKNIISIRRIEDKKELCRVHFEWRNA
jgi:medium-chain acyl-[acyl-carrier-protein] hydrolase